MLGVPESKLRVTGNIKSDLQLASDLADAVAASRQTLGARAVLTAGSTHGGEDEVLITAFVQHLTQHPDDFADPGAAPPGTL